MRTIDRLEEREIMSETFGWPADRWKTEPEWKHDIRIEAQVCGEEPLQPCLDTDSRSS